MSGLGPGRRALVLVAVLTLGGAACGSSSKGSSAPKSTNGSTAPASAADPLGTPTPASGSTVKVGLITDGGDCAECSKAAGDEQPVAEATAKWANEYLGGLSGHKIDLVVCVDDLDAAKAGDCANQMIRDGVAAVVLGASGVIESSWKVLHDAGIPVVNFGVTDKAMLQDKKSTFILQDSDALTVKLPLEVAKEKGAKTVSVIVVDLPIATDSYGGNTPSLYEQAGVKLDLVPAPLGLTDMTPQAQQVVSKNPDGVVMIVGHDAFCIPAINGLKAVGFTGTIVTISNCITDAMKKALPGNVIDGMVIAATAPLGKDDDPSMQQYNAVLDKYGASKVDRSAATPLAVYSAVAGLSIGTKGLKGEVTPASVMAAMRAMPNEVLPGTGDRHFRCNGQASPAGTAICMHSLLSATLDSKGNAVSYTVANDEPIKG
jgi:ABC-type branched-subunit amino acid transport system substrate-binding protein